MVPLPFVKPGGSVALPPDGSGVFLLFVFDLGLGGSHQGLMCPLEKESLRDLEHQLVRETQGVQGHTGNERRCVFVPTHSLLDSLCPPSLFPLSFHHKLTDVQVPRLQRLVEVLLRLVHTIDLLALTSSQDR